MAELPVAVDAVIDGERERVVLAVDTESGAGVGERGLRRFDQRQVGGLAVGLRQEQRVAIAHARQSARPGEPFQAVRPGAGCRVIVGVHGELRVNVQRRAEAVDPLIADQCQRLDPTTVALQAHASGHVGELYEQVVTHDAQGVHPGGPVFGPGDVDEHAVLVDIGDGQTQPRHALESVQRDLRALACRQAQRHRRCEHVLFQLPAQRAGQLFGNQVPGGAVGGGQPCFTVGLHGQVESPGDQVAHGAAEQTTRAGTREEGLPAFPGPNETRVEMHRQGRAGRVDPVAHDALHGHRLRVRR